jgi:hypothetical protein
VLGKYVGIASSELVEKSRRALDVGEEERDGAGRQLSHAHMIARRRLGANDASA